MPDPIAPTSSPSPVAHAAAQGFTKETVSLMTPDSPHGRVVNPGRAVVVPRRLERDGVVGVRLVLASGNAAARVGNAEVPVWSGSLAAGHVPLHGELTLTGGPAVVQAVEVFTALPRAGANSDYYPVDRTLHAGDSLELKLSQTRKNPAIDQIECIWTASYGVPDPSGKKSDEGKPFYLDGVYAQVALLDSFGRERPVSSTRFVDANEVDNLHDLGGLRGDALRLKFFAKNPAGERHPVSVRGVRVRYSAGSEPMFESRFERVVDPGQSIELELPVELRSKPIARVEVRWTDMLSGTWLEPGYAYGALVVDGKTIGAPESVQSPETQVFTHLAGLVSTTGKVGVRIDRDRARVDSIRVYFEA
jgi:hypothetical protein